MAASKARKRLTASMAAILGAVAVSGVVTASLHARVDDVTDRPGRGAMPVDTVSFDEAQGYDREQRFLGVVRAATRGDIGFEVAGAVARIDVREGDTVEAGAALARLDTRSLEARRQAAAATVEQVSADLELARARSQRQAPLVKSGAISAQAFDDTRLTEKALAARLEAARAELARLEIDLEKSVLRAPYAARIGRKHVDAGTVTEPGRPVLTLIARGSREAQIGIAVEQADALEIDREYRLTLRERELTTTLRAIRPDVNPVSMTIAAIFLLPEGTDAFDGEPVTIALPRPVREAGGWLPVSALLEGDRGVWTVLALRERNGATVALREVVEVLHVSGDRAYVRGTLNDGDRVIGDGVHRVAPGTRVTVAGRQVAEV